MGRRQPTHVAIHEALEKDWHWGDLTLVVEANLELWDNHADVFSDTLEWEQWFEIYQAVRRLQQLTLTAPEASTLITSEDEPYLSDLADRIMKAIVVLTFVAVTGTRQHDRLRRVGRRIWWRLRPPDDDELIADVEERFGDQRDRREPDSEPNS